MLQLRNVPLVTILIGLLPFVLAACSDATSSSTDPRTQPPLVRTETVEISVQSERSFSGIVAARVQSDLGFRIPGKVLARLVDAGQTVKRGQALMRIDPTDLRLAMRAHEEAVAAAKARMRQTSDDEARQRDLVAVGAVSRSAYDRAKAAAEATRTTRGGGRPLTPKRRRSEPRANLTDPDSSIMRDSAGYLQGYNAQAVVTEHQIIVAADVTQEPSDN